MGLTVRRLHARASLVLVPAILVLAGCGGGGGEITAVDDPRGTDRSALPSTDTDAPNGEPSETSGSAPNTSAGDPMPPPTSAPALPAEVLTTAVAAYRDNLAGAGTIRALQLTVWFPESGRPYASLEHQDPAQPANVDERAWRDGVVEAPEPVQLTGGGSLEENLFGFDEVDWSAIAGALAGAPALVEQQLGTTFENSQGVTHVIVTKDLPFSPNTVARVYVDGGDRTTGGYVQYLANGTLDKVQA